MDEHDWLAERFEEHCTHLRAVAYRMPGSLSEADDAVQEAWLRLSRAITSGIENLVPKPVLPAQQRSRGRGAAGAHRSPRSRPRRRRHGAFGRQDGR